MTMNLKEALTKIEELEEQIADLEMEIDDLKQDAEEEELYGDLYAEDEDVLVQDDPEYLETLDAFVFLREIGLDPFKLPSSVGERMEIRDRLASPIPDLTQALDECQDQYKYLEQHYNRAFELGYDPITKEFYCRACAKREWQQ